MKHTLLMQISFILTFNNNRKFDIYILKQGYNIDIYYNKMNYYLMLV